MSFILTPGQRSEGINNLLREKGNDRESEPVRVIIGFFPIFESHISRHAIKDL